jgi:hypothetical protein
MSQCIVRARLEAIMMMANRRSVNQHDRELNM